MDALFIDSSLDIFCSSFIDRRVKEFDKTFTICLCLGREWQGVALDKNKTVSTDGVTVTDNGITITASEVYCDGLSVFLSAQVYAEQGGFSNIPAHYVSNTNENSTDMIADMLYLRGDWKLSDESEWYPLTAYSLEGKVIDDHTFAGMLKLDMNAQKIEQGNMTLTRYGLSAIYRKSDNQKAAMRNRCL